jgi:hypothetical protein
MVITILFVRSVAFDMDTIQLFTSSICPWGLTLRGMKLPRQVLCICTHTKFNRKPVSGFEAETGELTQLPIVRVCLIYALSAKKV